jgi:hypothetical protein
MGTTATMGRPDKVMLSAAYFFFPQKDGWEPNDGFWRWDIPETIVGMLSGYIAGGGGASGVTSAAGSKKTGGGGGVIRFGGPTTTAVNTLPPIDPTTVPINPLTLTRFLSVVVGRGGDPFNGSPQPPNSWRSNGGTSSVLIDRGRRASWSEGRVATGGTSGYGTAAGGDPGGQAGRVDPDRLLGRSGGRSATITTSPTGTDTLYYTQTWGGTGSPRQLNYTTSNLDPGMGGGWSFSSNAWGNPGAVVLYFYYQPRRVLKRKSYTYDHGTVSKAQNSSPTNSGSIFYNLSKSPSTSVITINRFLQVSQGPREVAFRSWLRGSLTATVPQVNLRDIYNLPLGLYTYTLEVIRMDDSYELHTGTVTIVA